MRKLLSLLVCGLSLLGCGEKYNDSALRNGLDDLENRVAKLEERCKQMNTNISALQEVITALQNSDYITSVTPITKDGKTVGYTITFAKSNSITIYNGKDGSDGKDGTVPTIGVKQDTDGFYYWTLNGEWLTDSTGNKIKTEGKDGTDGSDGITPQLKIDNGYWFISYNKGASWTKLDKATGEDGTDGKDGKNSIFKSVTEDDDNVYFTLDDNSIITIPKGSRFRIDISDTIDIGIFAGETKTIDFSIIGGSEKVRIKAIAQNGWNANILTYTENKGKLQVTAPNPLIKDDVLIFAYEPTGETTMICINFVEGVIVSPNESAIAPRDGGIVEIPIETNVSYTVSIPQIHQYWISAQSTRALHNETLTFNVNPNKGNERSATITLLSEGGNYTKTIIIVQEAAKTETYTGNVTWTTVDDIVAFKNEGYTIIDGNLTLSGAVISSCNGSENYLSEIKGDYTVMCETLKNFDGFRALKKVGGNVIISDGVFESFDGLENLSEIGGAFEISGHNKLTKLQSFKGLNSLQKIGGFKIYAKAGKLDNDSYYALSKLASFEGLESLTNINGDFSIQAISGDVLHTPNEAKALSALASFKGLNSLKEITGNFEIHATAQNSYTALCYSLYSLQSFNGLENLTRIGGDFSIYGLARNNITIIDASNIFGDFAIPFLSSLKGLNNLREIGGSLSIIGKLDYNDWAKFQNPPFRNLASLSALEKLNSIGQNITIQGCKTLTDFTALKSALQTFSGTWTVNGNLNNPTVDEVKSN